MTTPRADRCRKPILNMAPVYTKASLFPQQLRICQDFRGDVCPRGHVARSHHHCDLDKTLMISTTFHSPGRLDGPRAVNGATTDPDMSPRSHTVLARPYVVKTPALFSCRSTRVSDTRSIASLLSQDSNFATQPEASGCRGVGCPGSQTCARLGCLSGSSVAKGRRAPIEQYRGVTGRNTCGSLTSSK
jgi:hypothetical protein